MLIYKNVQLHIIIIHRHVSVTPLTVVSVSCDKNIISIQIIVQKCMVKPLNVTCIFSENLLLVKIQFIPTIWYHWIFQ